MKRKMCNLLVICVGIAAIAGSANAQRPDGISYAVDVKTSFGVEFSDCLIFGNDGVLTIIGLGIPQFFDQKDLGRSQVFWQSVTFSGFGFSIAFSGMATGNESNGMLWADAVSEFGDTFTMTGEPADCAGPSIASIAEADSSPWMQR